MGISSYHADNLKLAEREMFTPKQLAEATVGAFPGRSGMEPGDLCRNVSAGDSDTYSSGQWAGHA